MSGQPGRPLFLLGQFWTVTAAPPSTTGAQLDQRLTGKARGTAGMGRLDGAAQRGSCLSRLAATPQERPVVDKSAYQGQRELGILEEIDRPAVMALGLLVLLAHLG